MSSTVELRGGDAVQSTATRAFGLTSGCSQPRLATLAAAAQPER